eukprot:6203859-Pleurochrysis_carterae.AAC.2
MQARKTLLEEGGAGNLGYKVGARAESDEKTSGFDGLKPSEVKSQQLARHRIQARGREKVGRGKKTSCEDAVLPTEKTSTSATVIDDTFSYVALAMIQLHILRKKAAARCLVSPWDEVGAWLQHQRLLAKDLAPAQQGKKRRDAQRALRARERGGREQQWTSLCKRALRARGRGWREQQWT